MNNLNLFKINCNDLLIKSQLESFQLNVFEFSKLNDIKDNELEYIDKKDSKSLICIRIENYEQLKKILLEKRLEFFNLPTLFILSQHDSNIIKTLYNYHYINIYFDFQPITLIAEQIYYMFKNYTFFTSLKSSNVLSSIDTDLLTKKEVEIIKLLAESPLKKLDRYELFSKVWGQKYMNTNTLDVHLCNIRRKLKATNYRVTSVNEGKVALDNNL